MRQSERVLIESIIEISLKKLWGKCIDLAEISLPSDRQYSRVRKEILDTGNSVFNDIKSKLDEMEKRDNGYSMEIRVKDGNK